jgi:hypothetical protein
MTNRRRGLRKSTIAGLLLLPPIIGLVIYNSFHVSDYECTVCIEYEGQTQCRTVTGASEAEGLQSATTNACATLAGGMTDTIRCERTPPKKSECRQLVQG